MSNLYASRTTDIEIAAFKAGMIAMMYESHLELTGRPFVAKSAWDAKDEAVLGRLYAEWKVTAQDRQTHD